MELMTRNIPMSLEFSDDDDEDVLNFTGRHGEYKTSPTRLDGRSVPASGRCQDNICTGWVFFKIIL